MYLALASEMGTEVCVSLLGCDPLLRWAPEPRVELAASKDNEVSRNNKCWWGLGEKGIPHWWECKWVQPLWRTVWRFLYKLKTELPYNLAIPLLGIYPKEMKTLTRKDTCTPVFTAALFTIAKIWKQPKYPSMGEWIKKMWSIYTMEYYWAIKKEEILPFAITWMDLEGIMLNEISQTEKDKHTIILLIGGNLKTKQNKKHRTDWWLLEAW